VRSQLFLLFIWKEDARLDSGSSNGTTERGWQKFIKLSFVDTIFIVVIWSIHILELAENLLATAANC
jgi:hypothetical protein